MFVGSTTELQKMLKQMGGGKGMAYIHYDKNNNVENPQPGSTDASDLGEVLVGLKCLIKILMQIMKHMII